MQPPQYNALSSNGEMMKEVPDATRPDERKLSVGGSFDVEAFGRLVRIHGPNAGNVIFNDRATHGDNS